VAGPSDIFAGAAAGAGGAADAPDPGRPRSRAPHPGQTITPDGSGAVVTGA